MKYVRLLIDFTVDRHRIILVFFLLISIPLGYYFSKYEHFNGIDIYFDSGDTELNLYRNFQKNYGNEEFIVISFRDDDIFTADNINLIKRLTEHLESNDGVQRVLSLTNYDEPVGSKNEISFEKVISEEMTENELLSAKKRILKNPVLVNGLISENGKTAGIYVEIYPLIDHEKKRVLSGIIRSTEKIAGNRVKLHFGGIPFAETEMNRLSEKDFTTFIPFTFILILLIVIIVFRNITLALLCQLNILLILIAGIGFFVLTGAKFNLVTTIMGGILLAVSVADSIHLLSQYSDGLLKSKGPEERTLKDSVYHIWLPCFLTSITTCAGFISFLAGDIQPVKDLGIYTAAGIFIAFIYTVFFLPAIVALLRKKIKPAVKKAEHDIIDKYLVKFGSFVTGRYRELSILFFILIVVSSIGIFRLSFETNTMNYIPPENRIRSDIDFIEKNLTGTVPYIILVKPMDEANDYRNPESIKFIEDIQRDIMKAIPEFRTSYSVADYFKEINRAFNNNSKEHYSIPNSREEIMDFYEIGDAKTIERVVSPDLKEAKLSFQLTCETNEAGGRIHNFISSYMKRKTYGKYTYEITGLTVLYVDMEEKLKRSQIRSFSCAFIIIFLMFLILCRDFKIALLCMIPNLFPICITMGIMGWFGIPLDVVTVMIASIIIGIAVDDTIHYIVWYKRNLEQGLGTRNALLKAYSDVGKPILVTTVILFAGFFVFIAGSILPTRTFGVLTSFSMLFALIGDIIFLPAVILFLEPVKEGEEITDSEPEESFAG